MIRAEVLYRDSSATDGVQSRGAGWHTRPCEGGTWKKSLSALLPSLRRGDLLKTEKGSLYVCDGSRLLQVPSPTARKLFSQYSYGSKSLTSCWARPDGLLALWSQDGAEAADLCLLAADLKLDPAPLVLAACLCVEQGMRLLREEEWDLTRTLRTVRGWAAGLSTGDQLLVAVDSMDRRTTGSVWERKYRVWAVRGLAHAALHTAALPSIMLSNRRSFPATLQNAVANVSNALKGGVGISEYFPRSQRSMAYLVRSVLPAWRVCLATSGDGG